MENIEEIINRCKGKKEVKRVYNYKGVLTKILLSCIFLFACLIYIKQSEDNKIFFKEKLFTDSMSFTKVNKWYTDNFGDITPTSSTTEIVFSNNLSYTNITDYEFGESLTVQKNSLVSNIMGGIVVFIGDKESFGNTVIVQGNDGYDIWYGNINNVSVNLYDYLDTETILGETNGDKLYLAIKKDNEYIKYETYKNQ